VGDPAGRFFVIRFLRKHRLHEEHVQHRSRDDGEQRVPLPCVQQDDGGCGDDLRQAEGRMRKGDPLETVDHEHTHDRIGQHMAEIGDDLGCFALAAEDPEGQKPQQRRDECRSRNEQHGMLCIDRGHIRHPPVPQRIARDPSAFFRGSALP